MKPVARVAFAALAAAAAAALCLRLGGGVETDLLGLTDSRHAGLLREIASASSRQGRILISGPAGIDLTAQVDRTLAALGQPRAGSFKDSLAALADYGAGLLSPRVRGQLAAGRYTEAETEALSRLFGPVPPLVGVKQDPFLLVTDYAMSLERGLAPGWTLKNGYPSRELDGREYVLLAVDLTGVSPVSLAAFLAEAEQVPPPVRVQCGGPAFHAAATSERAKTEINWLSALSVVAVLVIGFFLFGSFRFVPRLACVVGFSGLLATGTLFWCFPRPHVLTFVFGTSLIGLAVDYVYHASAAGDVGRIRRPLTLAMLTTIAAFVPLMFAEVTVLRQMALFTSVGLMSAWGWVMFSTSTSTAVSPSVSTPISTRTSPSLLRLALVGVLLLASGFGLPKLRLVSDPAAFYCPSAYLAESERMLLRLCPESSGRFVHVRGETLEEALEREEENGVSGLSAVFPSFKRQRENRELVRKLVNAVGADYTARTGIELSGFEVNCADERLLNPERLEDPHLAAIVKAMRTKGGTVSPCSAGFVSASPTVTVLEPKHALREMFAAFTTATCRLLGWSLLALVILLAAFFRCRFFAYTMPLAAALLATAGTLGLLGVEITFFTLLCFFVLVGLGVDYVIFHQGDASPIVRRTVFGSFLTSLIGLGALGFTGFAVTASMGFTFAVGLFYAWFFAWAFASGGRRGESSCKVASLAWHEQGEQSAGAWRIAFMWYVYRIFGKDALKAMCVPVMLFIYPFAHPARRALARFRKVFADHARACGRKLPALPSGFMHLLGFAWSLVDKTDLCTLRRSPPQVMVREDDGSRAFLKTVAEGRGAFLISSHLGTVEMLPALGSSPAVRDLPRPHLHAFQQLGHDAEFTRMFLKHFSSPDFELHAVEDIGVETAVTMRSAVERGELVLMAGDRVSAGSGKTLAHKFLGRPCVWPKGVFAFALLLECPVFFVTCVHTGRNRYEAHFAEWNSHIVAGDTRNRRLADMLEAYVGFLESETWAFPGEWYQFYPFFG